MANPPVSEPALQALRKASSSRTAAPRRRARDESARHHRADDPRGAQATNQAHVGRRRPPRATSRTGRVRAAGLGDLEEGAHRRLSGAEVERLRRRDGGEWRADRPLRTRLLESRGHAPVRAPRKGAWPRDSRSRGGAAVRSPLTAVARQSIHLRPASSRRCAPSSRSPSRSGPKATRSSGRTGWPTAAHMRLTWRLRPSWMRQLDGARARPAHAAPARSGRPRARRPSRSARSARSPTGALATVAAVGLGHLEARVRQPVGELAVVGQQDQPGVSASRRPTGYSRGRRGHELDHRRATVGVLAVETTPAGLLRA